MIGFATPLFGKADGPPPPPTGPIDPATLFGIGMAGGYYNFTDGASLAVNADGSGGVPAIGAACRSALDKSPNGNRLRNTVVTATRRASGIETGGANYGLFNIAGFGNWPLIPQPYEVVACLEQLAYAGTDARIIGANGLVLRQAATSGAVSFVASGTGVELNPGLNIEFVIDGYFSGSLSTVALNGGAMQASAAQGGGACDGMVIGSNTGGGAPTQVRFKHLLVIGRALTTGERSGVVQWMQA